jgi:hypothetical protein
VKKTKFFIIAVDTAWLHPNFFPSIVLQSKPLYLPHTEKKDEGRERYGR